MLKTPEELEKEQRSNPNKLLRTNPRNRRKTSLKNLNPLQLQHQQNQQMPVPPRIMILKTTFISMISSMLLSNLMISLKRNQLTKAR
jgi:hypothetical protein